jgi:hypothetical protein
VGNYVPGSLTGPVPAGLLNRPSARLRYTGEYQSDFGDQLQKAGLAGLDALDSQYTDELKNGGLPDYMKRAFDVQQGALTDNAARSRSAWGQDLLQMSRRGNGALDPNAALDYQINGDANTNDALFTARNNLFGKEADMRMTNTNSLLDRIQAIRMRKLGSGEATSQLGINARAAALGKGKGTAGQGSSNAGYAAAIASIIAAFA